MSRDIGLTQGPAGFKKKKKKGEKKKGRAPPVGGVGWWTCHEPALLSFRSSLSSCRSLLPLPSTGSPAGICTVCWPRYREGGLEALEPWSRRPKTTPIAALA